MKYTEISSKDNEIIKLSTSLQKSAKIRKQQKLFVIEGLRICLDAVQNGIDFMALLVTKSALEKHSEDLSSLELKSEKSYLLSDELFRRISDTVNPQGIIAIAKMNERSVSAPKNGRYIALENINDPTNLGAVTRTAEALGVSGIIITDNSCDPYSPKVLRASMGTLLRMPVYFTDSITDFAKKHGLITYACVVDRDAKSITDCKFENGTVLIIGNEANGVSDFTKENADYLITIKMCGKAESLNAASAASIAIWEMMK